MNFDTETPRSVYLCVGGADGSSEGEVYKFDNSRRALRAASFSFSSSVQ